MMIGKTLDINLTSGRIEIIDPPEELVRTFLGGRGINAYYLTKYIDDRAETLGPNNVLLFSIGVLTGTQAPASSRLQISSRSPLTGMLGSSNIGGHFGPLLRNCGIQTLIFRGRAESPVYLWCHDGLAELRAADHLWGLDVGETETGLKQDLDDQKVRSLIIGPAGENQVSYACIIGDGDHAAGRTGMGAVMGSKNLKAIVVKPQDHPKTRHPTATAAVKQYLRAVRSSNPERLRTFSKYGGAGDMVATSVDGMLGTKNFRQVRFDRVDLIDGKNLSQYVTRAKSCYRCPVACKADIKIDRGKFSGTTGGRPEYETLMSMGARCGLDDPEALLYLSNLCNRLGLDTISTGAVLAFAMDLYDRGILTPRDIDGIHLTWGNTEAMEALILKIVDREGVGDILSAGVRKAAKIIGKGSEKHAFHSKGLELVGADPRRYMGMALAYAVSARGADYISVHPSAETQWTPEKAEAELGTSQAVSPFATEGKGALVRRCMIVAATVDALGICCVPALSLKGDFDLESEAALLEALTGWGLTAEDLFRIGERIVNLERLFILHHANGEVEDSLPPKFIEEPVGEGPARGKRVNLVPMLKEFYHCMGWGDTGIPTKEKLIALGLAPTE